MGIGNIVEALQYFFLDIIGVIIPGISLIIGLEVILKANNLDYPLVPSSYEWIFLILASYVIGHFVTGIGNFIFIPIIGKIASRLKKNPVISIIVPKNIKSYEEITNEITNSDAFVHFKEAIKTKSFYAQLIDKLDSKKVEYWRDIAMTIGKDEKNIVYKFMFISLLTSGMGTVLIIISLIWSILSLLFNWNIIHLDLITYNLAIAILLIVLSLPFFERSAYFFGISMRVPFPIATVMLASDTKLGINGNANEILSYRKNIQNKKPRMYLAGGFNSGWQDIIIGEIPFFDYYDPRSHKISEEKGYTIWDLEAIRYSDWVFAYLEKGNPAGYALALEVGFAKAHGKKIVLVDEKSEGDRNIRKYMGMIHSSADIEFCSLQDALTYLRTIEKLFA